MKRADRNTVAATAVAALTPALSQGERVRTDSLRS
jgi:hypothetical protein